MLSGRQIVEAGIVAPQSEDAVQPASVDLRLGMDKPLKLIAGTYNLGVTPARYEPVASSMWVLQPGDFRLVATAERVKIPPEYVGRVEGKALSLDTEVPTPFGFRYMRDLRVGDLVFGADGQPTRITAVSEVMRGRQCYDVVFSDGTMVTADAGHLWAVTEKKHRRQGGRRETIVRTEDMVGNLRYGKEWNYHVGLGGAANYPHIFLPIDPYVLGAWLGDGASASSTLYSADLEIVEEIRKFYPVEKAAGKYAWKIGVVGSRVEKGTQGFVRNGSFHEQLRDLGVLGNKHIPNDYFCASPSQRLALLQGLLDTDGHCTAKGQVEFSNTNLQIAAGVFELAASLGFRPYFYEDRATLYGRDCGPAYRIVFRPRTPVFRLPRKLSRQRLERGGEHLFRSVRSVTPVPSVPVKCITVEADDGKFLVTRSYLPTHNSSMARMGLIVHTTAGFIDPGFEGYVTLELANVGPATLVLTPHMYLCQLSVHRMERVDGVYKGKYQGARGVEGAKLV